MGKLHYTIKFTLNEDTGLIEELDMTEGIYNRVEFVSEFDKPISIRHAMTWLREDLEWSIR